MIVDAQCAHDTGEQVGKFHDERIPFCSLTEKRCQPAGAPDPSRVGGVVAASEATDSDFGGGTITVDRSGSQDE